MGVRCGFSHMFYLISASSWENDILLHMWTAKAQSNLVSPEPSLFAHTIYEEAVQWLRKRIWRISNRKTLRSLFLVRWLIYPITPFCEILNGRTNLPYVSHMDSHRTFPTRHTAAKIWIRNNIFWNKENCGIKKWRDWTKVIHFSADWV